MEQEIYILLKLIDDQQHTQHKLHQAKLKLSKEWIPVQEGSAFNIVVLMRTISCACLLRNSNRANLNPTTARLLATAMHGGQAPCRRKHPRRPPPESGRFVGGSSEPPEPGFTKFTRFETL